MSVDPLILCDAAGRMANEGIPVAAIGRVLMLPYEDVSTMLREELAQGHIFELPKPDWPPGVRVREHMPTIPITRSTPDADVAVACRKFFKMTNLEAGFIVLLLKSEHTTKAKLHHVIETQRLQRATRPDNMEMTDEKMVDVMICKLRKKLKVVDAEFAITTVWGGGYFIDQAIKDKIYARLADEGHRSDTTH